MPGKLFSRVTEHRYEAQTRNGCFCNRKKSYFPSKMLQIILILVYINILKGNFRNWLKVKIKSHNLLKNKYCKHFPHVIHTGKEKDGI